MSPNLPNPNPEPAQLVTAVLKLLIACVCATLYSWGGMEDLWLRRIVAPVIAVGTMYYFTRNPWTLGSYSYYKVGQYQRFAGAESEPVGTCHFAGEHTSIDAQGYLEGAVESGARAAREVLVGAGVVPR